MFTTFGFFSAVRTTPKGNTLMIRARLQADTLALNQWLIATRRQPLNWIVTPKADYRYRAILPAARWARITKAMTNAIDYTNFKNRVHDGTVRDMAYMRVWSEMYALQQREGIRHSKPRKSLQTNLWSPLAAGTGLQQVGGRLY